VEFLSLLGEQLVHLTLAAAPEWATVELGCVLGATAARGVGCDE
jgi:hypothetical protein